MKTNKNKIKKQLKQKPLMIKIGKGKIIPFKDYTPAMFRKYENEQNRKNKTKTRR